MATSQFPAFRVGDLVDQGALVITDGYRVTNQELGDVGVPFVRGGDIGDGWIVTDVEDHILPTYADRVTQKLSKPEDVAFIIKGTVGRVGYLRREQPSVVFAPQVSSWRVLRHDLLSSRFIYYLLRGHEFQACLDAVKTHGAMVADYVSLNNQMDFRLHIPPIGEQRGIAFVLGALDDKIESNRRMNATLEVMARAMFKSWFVDFDPVRAKAEGRPPVGMDVATAAVFPDSFEDSRLGEIPKEWQVGRLGDVASNVRRTVDATHIKAGTPYISLEHMPRRSVALAEWGESDGVVSNKFWFHRNEILFGKLRPYFHKIGVAPTEGVCSTDILVTESKNASGFGFVLAIMSSDELVRHADSVSTGTKMPRCNWTDLARYEIVIPPDPALEEFNRIAKPMINVIVEHVRESHTLANIRNTLLPKLLSGDIRVSDAEKLVGTAT